MVIMLRRFTQRIRFRMNRWKCFSQPILLGIRQAALVCLKSCDSDQWETSIPLYENPLHRTQYAHLFHEWSVQNSQT